MRSSFLIFLIVFSSKTSIGQMTLVGEWKPVKVSVYDIFNNKTSIAFDNNDRYLAEKNSLKQIDSAKLIFYSDSTIVINSYGLLMPSAVPGWAFGERVKGKWTQQENKLAFFIGDDKIKYPFFYNIIKETKDTLILCYTGDGYGETCIMNLELIRE